MPGVIANFYCFDNNEHILQLWSLFLPQKKCLIIFDIDGTMTPENNGGIDQESKSLPCIQEFQSRRMLLDIEEIPYLLPIGLIELLQLLDEHPDVELAFFSAGLHWRNELFVKKLLCLSLGAPRYQELKPTLKIMSREQLVTNDTDGLRIKDLSKMADDIENTIIIDDNILMFNPEHLHNVLRIIPITLSSFYKIHRSLITHPGKLFTWDSFVEEDHSDDHFASANQLFYITGVLFLALYTAKKEAISLRDALTAIQFKSVTQDETKLESCHEQLSKEPEFYFKGLKLLQQKNEHLYFIDDLAFLGNYFPLSPQLLHERMVAKGLATLEETIHQHIHSSPKLQHGFFAGQLPKNLREIQKQLLTMKTEEDSHHDALLTIISITEQIKGEHPILRAAKAYQLQLQESVLYESPMTDKTNQGIGLGLGLAPE